MKKVLMVLAVIVMIATEVFAGNFDFIIPEKREEFKKNYEKAATPEIGGKLGMVVMDYDHIGDGSTAEIGYDQLDHVFSIHQFNTTYMVWVSNVSKGIVQVNPLHFKLVTKEGTVVPLSNITYQTTNPFKVVRLEPGTRTNGFIAFDYPMGEHPSKIIYDDGQGNRIVRAHYDANILGMPRRVKRINAN